MKLVKNIKLGKNSFFLILIFLQFLLFFSILKSETNLLTQNNEDFVQIKILDKVSSKNTTITLKIGEEKKFQNLIFRSQKCRNSKFDDNPEITAYLQVRDLNKKNKDKVFIFNGWTFASSPSIKPFDHPVYDIWIIRCFN